MKRPVKKLQRNEWIIYSLGCLFLFSQGLYYLRDQFQSAFFQLMTLMSVQFALYLGLWKLFPKEEKGLHKIWYFLLFVAVASRLILIPSDPILEDDFYRYLWDGKVLLNGINPYRYTPGAAELDSLHESFRLLINYPQFKTIYPPTAQFLFAPIVFFFGPQILGLKVVFLCFDFAVAFLLFKMTREKYGLSPTFLYLLSPLILKEVANSVHLDIVACFLVLLSLYFFHQRSRGWKVFLPLALSTGVKFYSVFLMPFFWFRSPEKVKNLFIFIGTIFLLYLPFLGSYQTLFDGMGAFSKYWSFNASLQAIALSILEYFLEEREATFYAKSLCGVGFVLYLIYLLRKQSEDGELYRSFHHALLALLLLSPVFNAWYMLWFLPFAFVLKDRRSILLSYLIFFGYSYFEYDKSYLDYRNGLFLVYGLFCCYEFFQGRRKKNVVVLMTKTPGLSPLKTRVDLDEGERERLYTLCLESLKYELDRVLNEKTDLDWEIHIAEKEQRTHFWKPFLNSRVGLSYQEGVGLGEKIHHAYDSFKKRYSRVLIIGGDSPSLRGNDILDGLKKLDEKDFVLGPADDGGFYLFGGKTDLTKECLLNVDYSEERTYQMLKRNLEKEGTVEVLRALPDLDYLEDFSSNIAFLEKIDEPNPFQIELIDNLRKYEH